MSTEKLSAKKSRICFFVGTGIAFGLAIFWTFPCMAQGSEQAADQTAFSDDAELMQLEGSQVRQLEGEVQNAEMQAELDERRTRAYRLYAQRKVQELEKLKGHSATNDQQIAILQNWLKADAAMRFRDQQNLRALQSRLTNIEQNQNQVVSNLSNDVGAVREASINARSDDKFRQQMQMNYFNEMQTEMGKASWGPQSQGTYYSMGGMGFNGGQSLFGGGY